MGEALRLSGAYSPSPGMTSEGSGELESQFARQAQKGDRRAFDWLMQKHLKSIYNLVLRMLPQDRESAPDLVQEVFLSAFRSLASFRAECRIGTWFHRIAVNKVLNHKGRRRLPQVPLVGRKGEDEVEIDLEDPQARPGQRLEEKELQQILGRLVGDLPESLRLVFTLRELQRKPYEEVAAILETTPEAVRVRLHRAKKELARRLRPYLENGGLAP